MTFICSRGEILSLALTCGLLIGQPLAIKAQEGRRAPSQASSARTPQQGRLRPPDNITCDRNYLTVYTGRVVSYSRRTGRVELTIETDENTTEKVTLRHPRGNSPARWFLLRREKFKGSDWASIESSKGRLLPDMRVAAWVCKDGNRPIIDWQPPTGDGPAPPGTP